jgi:phosphoenolpyruvate-protein kinase (PTS system EI component)
MIRLTPFAETSSGQTLLKNERIRTLTQLSARKFALSTELAAAIQHELAKLDLATLQLLLDQILEIETFEQIEQWIADHLPTKHA